MIKKLFLLLFIFISFRCFSASVDTVSIYSTAMQKAWKCVVIKPTKSSTDKRFPVVYLLHGHSGSYSNWILRVPELMEYADEFQLMIVCPDGQFNSWYLDSPIDPAVRFETYIAKEVPVFIDANYPTINNRKGRAITGLSMGGHGGLFLGLRNASVFGACGSMSGGVDLRPFTKNWQLTEKLGDSLNHPENWYNYSVINIIDNKPSDPLAIIIDCGTEDFFYQVNHNLHEKLVRLKIPHDYIERPGQHNWPYWKNAVQYQLLFFNNYFSR